MVPHVFKRQVFDFRETAFNAQDVFFFAQKDDLLPIVSFTGDRNVFTNDDGFRDIMRTAAEGDLSAGGDAVVGFREGAYIVRNSDFGLNGSWSLNGSWR